MKYVEKLTVGSIVFATAVTVLVSTVPAVHFAYRSPGWHIGLGTISALVAVLAAFIVVGRVNPSARHEMLLSAALTLIAVSSVLVMAATGTAARSVVGWEGRACSLLGALLLAAAALVSPKQLRRRRPLALLGIGSLLVLAAVAPAVVAFTGVKLPIGVHPPVPPASTVWADFDAPWYVQVIYGVDAFLFAAAAAGFQRRAKDHRDSFAGWLAVAAVFAAASRVNYILFPSRYTQWVYTGDVFWVIFCGVLFIGTFSEITTFWRSRTHAAVLEERRRIAREFHDGLAQELAYVQRNLGALALSPSDPAERVARLQRAVERAQLESRQALAALSAPPDAPVEVVLERAVRDVAERLGAEVEFELVSGARVPASHVENLVRIACEAVANAARHSGQHRVSVRLRRAGRGLRLSVRDDGRGFDPASPTAGFGLVSMRERAQALNGQLRVETEPGRGTLIEVAL